MKFSNIKAVVLDMDGVLWRGDEPLPGLSLLFDWLSESRTPFMLATNNSTRTPADYVEKLARMGVVGVPETTVVTASTATAAYMRNHYPAGTHLYVIGMDGLKSALEHAGFDTEENDQPVQVVVSGGDFGLTYEKLMRATLYIRGGADFIGTNPDLTYPTPMGLVPGAGSILAALQASTGVTPRIIGKPHSPMFETALILLNTSAAETLMVGDRLDTDILGAHDMGMPTALMFTGVTQPDELEKSDVWPDVAYETLNDLVRAWAGDDWWREKTRAIRRA